MFNNTITDGLLDFGKCVSVHRINEDTEFLQITSAREETLLQMRTRFGKSLVSSLPMSEAAHSTQEMRDEWRRSVMPLYGNSNSAIHPAADAALQLLLLQPSFPSA